jgi:hypothetical protein
LPNGEIAPVYWCSRNRVLLQPNGRDHASYVMWAARNANEVQLFKNREAEMLGRLKRGIKERPSAAKAAAARMNGVRPCAPGKHRGRPRKSAHLVKTMAFQSGPVEATNVP